MSTTQINVRMEAKTKAAAEAVFHELGLSPTDAVRMFYKQVIMQQGLPFSPRIMDSGTINAPSRQFKKIMKASLRRNKETLDDLAKR